MTADLRPIRTAAESALCEAFAAAKGRLPGGAGIAVTREAAFRHFEQQGLPHRRVEEWKYTDLRALMRDAKPLSRLPDSGERARAQTAGAVLDRIGARRLVFADGVFVAEHSDLAQLEPGLKISSLAEVLTRGDPAIMAQLSQPSSAGGDAAFALNTAFMGDGIVIEIAAGAKIARPIHLIFAYISDVAATVFTRSLIAVGSCASVTLIESHEGPEGLDYQINGALDLTIGEGAEVEHIKIGAEGGAALHLATLTTSIGTNARYRDFTFTTGGAVTRNQLFVRCDGAGTTLDLRGASMLKGGQHADTTLVLDHAVGGCVSRELYKSVLDGESRGVFQGKIIVRPDAQKTDARMMSHALLLSEMAEADNKPELEIFADDVQCGHGATAGALDDNLKFYLMARGIPENEAEALLIESFVGDSVDAIGHEGVRDALMGVARRWLDGRSCMDRSCTKR